MEANICIPHTCFCKIGQFILNNSLFVELVIGIKFQLHLCSAEQYLKIESCTHQSVLSSAGCHQAYLLASCISNSVTAQDNRNTDRYFQAQPWWGQIPLNLPCLLILKSDSTWLWPQHEAFWQPITAYDSKIFWFFTTWWYFGSLTALCKLAQCFLENGTGS